MTEKTGTITKEELQKKLETDPEARAKFLASASKFYDELGLGASHEDITALKTTLGSGSHPLPTPYPIVILLPIRR
ncbi:hypothetical protein [Paracidobacterium acidisoli]|uniref:Nif11 domain-containing protein n=1 Tax=Paracidobacterium acidisoli TaxID=2303751 RepID=A0A372IM98_9BACT|nr:hypothetical protein [Paracidobacterium acidisoli]MBT9331668.1 hypothetical protein [Paracidobacterium acidisoli]